MEFRILIPVIPLPEKSQKNNAVCQMFVRELLLILSQGIVADYWGIGCWLFQRVSLNDLTVLILIIVLFWWENTNSLCLFFSSIFQDRAVAANLKYFGYKTVTDVLLPLKEMKRRRIWDGTVFERICWNKGP